MGPLVEAAPKIKWVYSIIPEKNVTNIFTFDHTC